MNPGTILNHSGRAVRAGEVRRSRKVLAMRGEEAGAGARVEIGYRGVRKEVEVEKGKEAGARREDRMRGAAEEVGAEMEDGVEIRGVEVGRDGGGT